MELARSAEAIVKSERRNVAAVIAHLAEMARREAHLELGYKSLFDYCVRHLRLSEGSVWSRIQVANVCRKYPQVLEHLAAGKISLSVAGRLASKLTGENVDRLLGECEGRTKREVEELLVALEPKPETPAGIRRAPMNTETSAKAEESPSHEPATAPRENRAASSSQPRKNATTSVFRPTRRLRRNSSTWPRSWGPRPSKRTWPKSSRRRST